MKVTAACKVLNLALFIFLVSATWTPSKVRAQTESFYKGKTVRIIVGFTPGGFYDRWARLLGRYMGKHIPGNPGFIVQNMPGAGSRIAANYIYNVAKPDGLTFGTINKNLYIDQLVGTAEVQYDWARFKWLGTPEQPPDVLYIRKDGPYKTLEDVKNAAEPPKCGSTGKANSGYLLPKLLEETMGMKFNVVVGYKGGRQIDLAVERGEVVCRAQSITPHFARQPFLTWHKEGFDWHLFQTGKKPWPGAPDIPSIFDLAKKYKVSDEDLQFITLVAGTNFGKPYAAPPGLSDERLSILRKAFTAALRDPQALAEAKKLKMDVELVTGEEVERMAKEVFSMSPKVINRFKELLRK